MSTLPKVTIVTTTIRVPVFLEEISENALRYHKDNINFIIIGDKNTPQDAINYCINLDKKYPYSFDYYSIEDQERELKQYQDLLEIVPYNSGSRKLLGCFIAYKQGADVVIQIDDDNFIGERDFVGEHCVVSTNKPMDLYHSETGWYNIYENIIEESNIPIFPRGYPWGQRIYSKQSDVDCILEEKKVVLINGLVYEDPDIDAISRLFWPIRIIGMKDTINDNFGLYPGTWTSFNNQNTSMTRELAQVYFTPIAAGRNSDIWTSYVMCRLVEEKGDVIAFGAPYVKQFRNPHDLWDDLELELLNNKTTDIFVSILKTTILEGDSYIDLLKDLIKKSIQLIDSIDGGELNSDQVDMMKKYFEQYNVWAHAIE